MSLAARAWRDSLAWLSRGWRDAVYLQERLMRLQRPWEFDGPLRWRRQNGGSRLVGSWLPVDETAQTTKTRKVNHD
jgi:hypothetical protein